MSMKNSNDTIGNRSRDLLICRAVSQPLLAPRARCFKVADEILVIMKVVRFVVGEKRHYVNKER
jgi:hypothetical protein